MPDAPRPGAPEPVLPREEAEAVLGARRELGPEMEPAVIDAFVDRVERAIDERMRDRPARTGPGAPHASRGSSSNQLALAIISIPLTAITLSSPGGAFAFLIVWMGIVAVNVAHAMRRS